VSTCLQREIYEQVRARAGASACPSVVIMDGKSVKTTEHGGVRGFDGHKRVKDAKRYIVVNTLSVDREPRRACEYVGWPYGRSPACGFGPVFPEFRR
jgi:hypothetical protein